VPVVGSVGFDDRVQPEVHTRLTVQAGIEMPALISEELEYVGFWPRVGAALIDTLLIMVVTVPLVTAIYGKQYWISDAWLKGPADFLINWVLPAGAVLLFWIYRQATPGKIAIGARIVDAETGGKPSTRQLVGRYVAYYVSIIPFMAGIVWVAFDPRKQGWHDKLARTVVVRPKQRGPVPVSFASDSSSKAGSQ
jgi:uncharacterized RDD family membrane protein YckC